MVRGKVNIISFVLLLCITGLTACNNTQAVQEQRTYTDKEKTFMENYRQARELIDLKEDISPAPTEQEKTGFAILPLDKKVYGVEAFAFLPIEERSLTEEEMQQLVYTYQGCEPEEILREDTSYRGNEENGGNRER